MHIKETFKFSRRDYRERKSESELAELREDIYAKRRNLVTAKTSAVVGVLCVPVSAGMSLLGVAYQWRNISVEKRKLKELTDIWIEERKQDWLEHRSFKDKWLPMFITSLLGCFIFSVDLGISNASAQAAYAAQQGFIGTQFNAHAVSAYYTGIEKGMSVAGNQAAAYNGKRGLSDDDLEERD